MNSYFSLSDKVYDVTSKYPILIEVLAVQGFENLRNEAMRKTMGRVISIEMALKSKNINPEIFEKQMVEAIERQTADLKDSNGVISNKSDVAKVSIKGILPCPVRMQFVEGFENWKEKQDYEINYNLNAASMGLDVIEDEILNAENADALSDIYMSAGFNLFFDEGHMGKYKSDGIFKDFREGKLNKDLDNDRLSLKDPKGYYSIIGVVPAIFIVNTKVLGDRAYPKNWSDLFKPEFTNSISIPTKDLDMFNAIMLGIYTKYGKDGIIKLGRNLLSSMHPAQMVKTAGKSASVPAVTIMPYFFSKMIKEEVGMEAVWPEDGAIISPIFLLTKRDNYENTKPLIDFLFSDEVATLLGADGKFPQTNPNYDNALTDKQKFIWPGWDFLHDNNIGVLLAELEKTFYGSKEEIL